MTSQTLPRTKSNTPEPHNKTVAEVARDGGISCNTLIIGVIKPKKGAFIAGRRTTSYEWLAEGKLAVAIESASLSAGRIQLVVLGNGSIY